MKSKSKCSPTLGVMNDQKYSRSVKSAAPMKNDVKDHNGKYFNNVSSGESRLRDRYDVYASSVDDPVDFDTWLNR